MPAARIFYMQTGRPDGTRQQPPRNTNRRLYSKTDILAEEKALYGEVRSCFYDNLSAVDAFGPSEYTPTRRIAITL